MKIYILISFILINFSYILQAEELPHKVDLNANWEEWTEVPRSGKPTGWVVNSKFSSGEYNMVPVEGGLGAEIRALGADGLDFHLYNRNTYVKTQPNEVIRVEVVARGEGTLSVQGYCYAEDEDSLGGTVGVMESNVLLDPEKFQTLVFLITTPEARARRLPPASMRIALVLSPESAVTIRSVTATTSYAPSHSENNDTEE